jgi:meromycolic acid enoyl-[acyl-carrier-protein] reductase
MEAEDLDMIEKGKTFVVMGLLDPDSIAYAIGCMIKELGGRVVYTCQNSLLKRRYLDSSDKITEEDRKALEIRYCDATVEDEVRAVFAELGPVDGVVHSLAYANPKTCLGDEFHTTEVEDILRSYHVSAVSLATVARHAQPAMPDGGSIVALSFDTRHVYPFYNWMGVHKAALEALVRALARRHGRDSIRVNAVSAGPLATKALSKIPGSDHLAGLWERNCPLRWDPQLDKRGVAGAVAFLLGNLSTKITGQVLTVDAGASIVGGSLLDFELPKPKAG